MVSDEFRLKWLHGLPEYREDGDGTAAPTGGVEWVLLLERLAPDGEWERVDGMAACTARLEQMTNGGWWLGHERMLAARNGLDARRLPLPRRPIVC